MLVVTATVSWAASGWKLALFSTMALFYMVVVGYWPESMNSLSLIIISVPLAIAVGFGFGVWGFRSDRARKGYFAHVGHAPDHSGICLPAADSTAVRIRTGGRADCQRAVCFSTDGA